jgi:hypothetical protein
VGCDIGTAPADTNADTNAATRAEALIFGRGGIKLPLKNNWATSIKLASSHLARPKTGGILPLAGPFF